MTAWHVDEQGRTWAPFSRFTCPNHPDGPPTLPADGWDREELTVDRAYSPDELADLRLVIAYARGVDRPAGDRVEQMLGLCCIGHRWKVAGFEQAKPSDVTTATFVELMKTMQTPLFPPSILLAELHRASDG